MTSGACKVMAIVAAMAGLTAAIGCRGEPPGGARSAPAAPAATQRPLPRLVDLGARKCIPCKAMAPILENLGTDYADRLEVRFIDVWQEPEQAQAYRVRMIPTQIFYAADGRELERHEGFLSREDILATWKRLGVEL